ncbi:MULTISPECIES: B12-binding domain-containing radical SAM protein [Fusobacterium]|uniref:B12-binding domain-containing radical SAM protein n=1 Tax=Fusobacterium TaxID=848 RepID=UPI001F24BA02|nr:MULTISPECIES: B12-binding domain-containing radical SAM protein [Fusobacterium]MDY2980160.1 B12-binding domain-containing radical SAM protein [Fusobacterium sp.]
MRNILVGINSKYVHTNLAVRYLKKYIEQNSEEKIKIYESSINNNIQKIIRDIVEYKPDNIFFSVYIWNVEMVFKITKELKKILPNKKILLGGPEVSYNPDEILEKNLEIDGILIGEGENILLNFLTKDIKEVKGVYYREDNKIKFNGFEPLIENLDIIPFPYDDEELEDVHKIVYYESSRGCPFNCSYCMSSIDKSVRYFSLERTKKDLKRFIDIGTRLVKFVDRTFNLNKDRYMEIWKFLLENYRENITFHFEINANIFDDEVLEFLKKVPRKLFQFEIGVQTTNPSTMKAINRNNSLDRLFHNVTCINKNIHLHLDLIAGLPFEDYETFGKSFDYVYKTKCEMIQLGFLKMLKGTQMKDEGEKYGYKYLDFPPYEILSNEFISYKDICRLKDIEEVLDFYYNSQKFLKSVDFVVENFFESPFKFFESIGDFYKERGYLEVAHKEVAIFNNFVEYYEKMNFPKKEEFLEYLKFDYLFIGKPGFYPAWIEENKDKELHKNIIEKMSFRSTREAHKFTELERFSINIDTKERENINIFFDYSGEETKYHTIKIEE